MKNQLKGSLLIYGSDVNSRREKVDEILNVLDLTQKESNPDLLFVELIEEKKSIGIDQVRKLISFLSEKPYSAKYKSVVISQAQKLTIDAQNALLKTLEEPPSYATIILCTRTEEELLPTVLSRCKKIFINKKRVGESKGDSIDRILNMSLGERLSWAETQSKEEKEDSVELIEEWIIQEREVMIRDSNLATVKRRNLELLIQIKNDLEKTNVNQRLAIETLVLKLE